MNEQLMRTVGPGNRREPPGYLPQDERDAASGSLTASVVVCAHTLDRWDDLVALVGSLHQQSLAPAEIIIVSDHNPELLRRVRETWPDVTAIENGDLRGCSGARNTGVRAATGDIIAYIDDDAIADADWLSRHVAAYDSPNVLGVGGEIIPRWDAGRPAWFPEEFDWVVGCTYKGMPSRRGRLRNPIGANMSLRREVFGVAGFFENDLGPIGKLPISCDETELCIRASQVMPEMYYVYEPLARVRHHVPPRRSTWRYYVLRCYSEGLGKAQVADLVGADAGLAAERAYVTRALPAGVVRGVGDAFVRGEPAGLRRAAAIVAGLAITTFGYLRARLAGGVSRVRASARSAAETTSDSNEAEVAS